MNTVPRCVRPLCFLSSFLLTGGMASGATYLVLNNNDSGLGSLRQAIIDANSTTGITDRIEFAAPLTTITLASVLPPITDPVLIDGATGGNSQVVIDGNGTAQAVLLLQPAAAGSEIYGLFICGGGASGITTQANNTTIGAVDRGNILSGNASQGILVDVNVTGTRIARNIVGLDQDGMSTRPNGSSGIEVRSGATGTVIENNVISGNTVNGIMCNGAQALIQSNIVGLDSGGTLSLGNLQDGINMGSSANDSTISQNVVSGNGQTGIELNSNLVVITENVVGMNAAGSAAVPNMAGGIRVFGDNCSVGQAGKGNLISGNLHHGVFLFGAAFTSVQGNIIGLDAGGTQKVGNTAEGVAVNNNTCDGTLIGGAGPGEGNVITGNILGGIYVEGSAVTIQGNRMGTNAAGTAGLNSSSEAIMITSSATKPITIGGTSAGAGNIISGHADDGIRLEGSNVVITGNTIGLAVDGTTSIGNGGDGIDVRATSLNCTIGGSAAGAGNIIASAGQCGIRTVGTGLLIQGNSIGTNPSATVDYGSGQHGIMFATAGDAASTATMNTIAHSTLDNVFIGSTNRQAAVLRNSIDADCRYPVSFDGAIVANDPLDADTGANNQQNFPTIDPVNHLETSVTGALHSSPDTTFVVHLYSSAAGHVSGSGPGEVWQGSTTVTTDGSGNGTWSIPAGPFAAGVVLSAQAVAPNGDSSHFSTAAVSTVPVSMSSFGIE